MVLIVNRLYRKKVPGVMTRTLFSFTQRMTRIPTIEVDIEVNFEQEQKNIHIIF